MKRERRSALPAPIYRKMSFSLRTLDCGNLFIRILPNLNGIGPDYLHPFRVFGAVFLTGIVAGATWTPVIAQDFGASSFVLRNHSPFSAIIGIHWNALGMVGRRCNVLQIMTRKNMQQRPRKADISRKYPMKLLNMQGSAR